MSSTLLNKVLSHTLVNLVLAVALCSKVLLALLSGKETKQATILMDVNFTDGSNDVAFPISLPMHFIVLVPSICNHFFHSTNIC